MSCEACGFDAPIKHVKFEQNIGLFYARRSLTLNRNLCRPCIKRYFRSYTLTTLFLGWWGLISFVLTPIILINNIREYWSARKLADPGIAAMNVPVGLNAASVGINRSFAFKLTYGILVWAGVLALIAYNQVAFIEQHAPALNAKMHGGEITDGSDGEYAGLQVGKDIVALEADIKGKTWIDMRTELLERSAYLDDLNAENEKIQSRLAFEHNANLGANDRCEQWSISEFAPALSNYTLAENKLFAVAKNINQITPENSADLKTASDQEDSAIKRLDKVFSESDAAGCGK